MALPDYSSASTANFGGAASRQQVRRQRQRARKQDRRADRRSRRAVSLYDPNEEPTEYADDPVDIADTFDYSGADDVTGYQGQYVAPENSTEHPFYTPGASYARPGDNYYNINGTDIQRNYIERNPAAGYYGWASQMGYGGLDAKSQTVQGMYQDFATGYEASKAYNNFEGNFRDYLGMQNVPNLLEQLTSAQIGYDPGQFNARDRWQFRG